MSDDKCALCGYDWSNHISEAELTAAQQRIKRLERALENIAIRTEQWRDAYGASSAHEMAEAALGGDEQPCGHPASAVVSSGEGTHYCWMCERGDE